MNTYNHIVLASYKLPRGYMPTNKSFKVFGNQQQLYLFKYILASEILKVKISAAAILKFCVLIHLGVLLKNNNKCWIKNPSLLFKNWLKLEKYPSFMIFFLKTIFFSKFYDEYVPNWVFPLINMHMIYKNQLVATYQLKPSTRDARQVCHFLKKKTEKT